MILPIRTSIRPMRTPYANYAIIAANVAIFFLTYTFGKAGAATAVWPWAREYMLTPTRPWLWQFITYAFLHGGYAHIIGNMYFLYLFGNSVNGKLGNIGYVGFYLGGAVFSAIGHIFAGKLLSAAGLASPVLGASGAVAAVTGAYLVLFPQTLITIVYWFIFIGTMELPAFYLIALKMILLDNVIVRNTPNVAYDAHLAGYAFGIIVIFAMLGFGLISASGTDLWTMAKQWNRRRRYRDVVAGGDDAFSGIAGAKYVKAREIRKPAEPTEQDKKITALKQQITERLNRADAAGAADLYEQLMAIDKEQLLPRQPLLDIANQFMSAGKWQQSADAYERFLAHYSGYQYSEQVELMLGILYSRYLKKTDLAVKYLNAAKARLHDESQIKMCRDELDKLL